MLTLIKNGEIFAPEPLGKKDVLIAGDRIGALTDPGLIQIEGTQVSEIEAEGKLIFPGIIDTHVHLIGGGGEGGPATRTPEILIEDIVSSGVTTIIGCLGTDGITRHPASLLAKARALEEEGITAFIFSGSYEIPPVTLTGSIRSDLVLIDKVIGAGEIAISDHRSSQPTFEDLARLAAECRVGGMLSGKAGILHLHLGDGERKLDMLFRLFKETEIPPSQLVTTHINRNSDLFKEGIKYLKQGGQVDITVTDKDDELNMEKAVKHLLNQNVPLNQITASSDGNGSLPVFDNKGNLLGLNVSNQKALLKSFQSLVKNDIMPSETAISFFTSNPASIYKLDRKGRIEPGKDADLIILNRELELTYVLAKGRLLLEDGNLIARGTFSPKGGISTP
ncbi:MAG: beta-aspartyl-peptidase [Candidatus Aminicenantes bacterium]|nr:beta-aspartyl-peptidase [Candidatus Aminicenantes bacterium]